MHYTGPNSETILELTANHDIWLRDPATFWRGPVPVDLSTLPPEAQIVGCFILRNRSDE